MPTAEQILSLLERISNELVFLAIIYHAIILAFGVALAVRWKPSKRIVAMFLSSFLLSVGVIAFIYGNPFNGGLFSLFFVLLFIFSLKLPNEKIAVAKGWILIPAFLMVAFGFFYPHFLNTKPLMYLIAAPTGLIPCPTLSVVIGFALLFQSFNSKKWGITLALIGLFYGVFGALRLHVYIDIVLLSGALLLLCQSLKDR